MSVVHGPWAGSNPLPPIDGSGGPPYDGEMEARVRILEKAVGTIGESLGRLEAKLERIDQGVNDLRVDIG